MSVANLHETVLNYKLRRNSLNFELGNLADKKQLATLSRADVQSAMKREQNEIRDSFKVIYNGAADLQATYVDYTEIPEFEEEIERIEALYQEQLDEFAAWEAELQAQITTDSAELEEVNAYIESYQQMESQNIQEDFNFGLNK